MKTKVAIIYDFDKTLSPNDMQAYGYMQRITMPEDEFWGMCAEFTNKNQVDNILSYMYLFLGVKYQASKLNIQRI